MNKGHRKVGNYSTNPQFMGNPQIHNFPKNDIFLNFFRKNIWWIKIFAYLCNRKRETTIHKFARHNKWCHSSVGRAKD